MEDPGGEVPVADLLDALDLPRATVARWMDHLDAFFARHGGVQRYAGLCRLTAETRAALAQPRAADSVER